MVFESDSINKHIIPERNRFKLYHMLIVKEINIYGKSNLEE